MKSFRLIEKLDFAVLLGILGAVLLANIAAFGRPTARRGTAFTYPCQFGQRGRPAAKASGARPDFIGNRRAVFADAG